MKQAEKCRMSQIRAAYTQYASRVLGAIQSYPSECRAELKSPYTAQHEEGAGQVQINVVYGPVRLL